MPVLVVRRLGRVFAYVNSCPHVGAPLDWRSGQFLTRDKTHLLCASHGALFRIDDGLCIGGPCAGKALRPLSIMLKEGVVTAIDR